MLAEVFPDCCIVWNHRDPAVCIPSISDMMRVILAPQMDFPSEELGPLVLDHYAASMERGLALRDRLGEERFADVDYDALVADNLASVCEVYARFELPLGEAGRQAMEAHVASHPKDKHGRHEYDLARFGLTRDGVRERFADYVARFGV